MNLEKDLVEKISKLTRKEFEKRWKKLNDEDYDNGTRVSKDFLIYRMATDIELFILVYFSHYCEDVFNSFHTDCFREFVFGRRGYKSVRGAPRGYAKSTIRALFEPIHDFCYGQENYILLISSTKPQAVDKLKDIRRELLFNDDLAIDFGVQFTSPKPGESAFEVSGNFGSTMFKASGSRSELRGLRYGQHRPTKIILDDVEDSEEIHNEELRDKQLDWYREVISNLGTKNTNIVFVGTVLHKKSLLKQLSINPAYNSKIYKAVLNWSKAREEWKKWQDIYTDIDNENREKQAEEFFRKNKEKMLEGTRVLWPERESYYELMKEYIEKGHRAFFKEKQNQPIADEESLFHRFLWYREEKDGIRIEYNNQLIPWEELDAYGVLDPATGESKSKSKTKLDFSCILSGYQDQKGRLFVHSDWTKRARPTKYINEIFEHHEIMNYEKFAVETNLFHNLLLENIIKERRRRERKRKNAGVKGWGLKIPFYEIENREKKEKRIFTLEPKVQHGWILFNRTLSMEFMDQMEQFPNGDHDDGPDALEMLWGLVTNRYKSSPLNLQAMGGR